MFRAASSSNRLSALPPPPPDTYRHRPGVRASHGVGELFYSAPAFFRSPPRLKAAHANDSAAVRVGIEPPPSPSRRPGIIPRPPIPPGRSCVGPFRESLTKQLLPRAPPPLLAHRRTKSAVGFGRHRKTFFTPRARKNVRARNFSFLLAPKGPPLPAGYLPLLAKATLTTDEKSIKALPSGPPPAYEVGNPNKLFLPTGHTLPGPATRFRGPPRARPPLATPSKFCEPRKTNPQASPAPKNRPRPQPQAS